MGNIYKDAQDDIIKAQLDEMHARLKSGGGIKPLGYRDSSKPSLDYDGGTPAKIAPVSESTKKIHIDVPI